MLKKIKFSDIKKIQPILALNDKESMAQVKARSGCDIIFNGGIYTFSDRSIDSPLRIDGTFYGKYNTYGLSINNENNVDIYYAHSNIDKAKDFIGNYGVLVEANAIIDTIKLADDNERTAMGITKNKELIICCAVEDEICSTKSLAIKMLASGCEYAINLDGGGSTQYILNDGSKYLSGRNVVWYVGIWLKNKNEGDNNMSTKKVMLDPGHDANNVNGSPDGTYKEHEFALDMGNRIKKILERSGVEVSMTRTNGKEVSLDERCEMANAIPDLNLFVSLHSNAVSSTDGTGWSTAKGLSTHIIAKGGNAEKAAKAMVKRFEEAGITVRSESVVVSNFQVIRDTDAPAVLVEHGFHTNKEEVALLKTDSYRQKLAEAEAKGILDHLGLSYVEESNTNPDDTIEEAASWAQEAWIKANTKIGIDGKPIMDGTRPKDSISRQEIAVVLNRLGLLD